MSTEDVEANWKCICPQEYAELVSAIFGDSESDEDSGWNGSKEEEVDYQTDIKYVWTKVEEVEGLWHCRDFLSVKQQQAVLNEIDLERWFSDPLHNQAMRFGNLPNWVVELCALIESSVSTGKRSVEQRILQPEEHSMTGILQMDDESPLPTRILKREPLFDQMIVNSYQPGEGISAHVDLLRFEDGIAIVSLESPCVMSFRPVKQDTSSESSETVNEKKKFSGPICEVDPKSGIGERVDVLLNPGDLVITHGPARYNWTHEINRDSEHQVWQGQPIFQERRVSVTLRRLCYEKDAHAEINS